MPVSQQALLLEQAHKLASQFSYDDLLAIFIKPIVILSAPRSGSTLLFETLKSSEQLWSIGGESHIIFNAFPQLHASNKKFKSGALSDKDTTPELLHIMRAFFLLLVKDSKGCRYVDLAPENKPSSITLLEKTPRNALNIPFMEKLFPDMQVIFLYRDPRENISSIIEAWEVGLKTGRFVTFQNIPGWDKQHWCLLLPPGWRKMNGKSIPEISTFQWISANETILKDLNRSNTTPWLLCNYHDLVNRTEKTITNITEFVNIKYSGDLQARAGQALPLSQTIVTTPKHDKWKRHSSVLQSLASKYAPISEKLEQLMSDS